MSPLDALARVGHLAAFGLRVLPAVAAALPRPGWWLRPLYGMVVGALPLAAIVEEITRLQADDDGLVAVVVGLPKRLDGRPNDQTPLVEKFVGLLRARVSTLVVTQDERLTSVEAESLLIALDLGLTVMKGVFEDGVIRNGFDVINNIDLVEFRNRLGSSVP